ncbi:nicotinate-nucleotide adenylyltransferase [Candidatus Ruthia magnifica str. Cm (Calyptogena magnifica)]|uniref:Probable nicotinate-nucleotide adenylyltransferase n=1 Tax=Ruthia magnifica subsp. Calyptogena magnifica TaxID=413404 RepID=A1AVZ8_RUTMC|nr:nicotinate (nicotinamide) nucleotide adenylyltransferase [Candidatus Ruthturnera calyptogenae]ABL02105.1 nicotinate-nucleotide adenylyltransferase [Candidatus Ruthia magnifica str. Cm (Calyptogena magnifica)]
MSIAKEPRFKMISFFGGSFDPIHYGHLKNATQLKTELGLSKLFLMPCAKPVHKKQLNFNVNQRMDMLRLAVEEFNTLSIDTREVNHNRDSYTIDSLKHIQSDYQNDSICLIMGVDSFNTLSSWKAYQVFYQYCHLVVIARADTFTHQEKYGFKLTSTVGDLAKQKTGFVFFANNQILDISSSAIHDILLNILQRRINTTLSNKIRDQQNLSKLLPKSIIDYIDTL